MTSCPATVAWRRLGGVVLTLLLASSLAVGLPGAANAVGGPSDVRTTIQLMPQGQHRIVSSGRAPAGSTLVLQERPDVYSVWATATTGRADAHGEFRLQALVGKKAKRLVRTCVVRPGADACTTATRPVVRKRGGRIVLTDRPTEISRDTDSVVRGRVSQYLKGRPLRLQYRMPADSRWRDVPSEDQQVQGRHFSIWFGGEAFSRNQQGLGLRVLSVGDREVRSVAEAWTVDAYDRVAVGDMTPTLGSLIKTSVPVSWHLGSAYASDAVAPAGTTPTVTATVALPGRCSTLVGGVSLDVTTSQGAGHFSASIALDGIQVWSHTSGTGSDPTFRIDAAGHSQLTLTTSYDDSHPEWRPYFVFPDPFGGRPHFAYGLCSAPSS